MPVFSPKITAAKPSQREILESYINLWKTFDAELPRDVGVLPYVKGEIKGVIIAKLRDRPERLNKFLALMYRRLALFQKFSTDDHRNVACIYEFVGRMVMKSGIFGEEERSRVGSMMVANPTCRLLMNKVIAEDLRLRDELVRAGYVSNSESQLEAQQLADLANKKSVEIGMSIKMSADDFSNDKVMEVVRHAGR